MRELTPKQAKFVKEYLVDLCGKQAAIRAGYAKGAAEITASKLLRVAKVKAEIDSEMAKRARRVEVRADDVLRELMRLAFADPAKAFDEDGQLLAIHKMPEEARAAISGFDLEELTERGVEIGTVRKVKFWDKPKALELLGKHLRLFIDRQENSGPDGGAIQVVINKYTEAPPRGGPAGEFKSESPPGCISVEVDDG